MGAYQDNLRHVAEPQAPSERDKAVSTTIEDYEALWFTEALREFAHYGEHDPESQSGIAVAYASFIDQKVREEGRSHVTLYAHTKAAASTLMDALYYYIPDEDRSGTPMVVVRSIEESTAEALAHYIEDSELDAPPEPTADDELGVYFDEDEAKESHAMMEMEKAESEHLAEQERRAERAMEEGRW